MLRQEILRTAPSPSGSPPPGSTMDIAAVASVLVTSEDPTHPIEHAFDGLATSRWISAEPGEQTVIIAFDAAQAIRSVFVEVDEPEVSRTQEMELSLSVDGGRTYRHLLRQEYNFSPPDSSHETERWSIVADGVTHLRVTIKPDKGG